MIDNSFDQKKLDRINELAKKNKEGSLTEAETNERAILREEFLANFRKGFRQRMDSIKVVQPENAN